MFVPAFGAAISGHVGVYDFGQVEGKDGHAGGIHKFSRFSGAYPPKMWSKEIPKTPRAPRSRWPQRA